MRPPGRLRVRDPKVVRRKFYLSASEDARLGELVEAYGSRSRAVRTAILVLAALRPAERELLERRAGVLEQQASE